jgi:hypothetical protein
VDFLEQFSYQQINLRLPLQCLPQALWPLDWKTLEKLFVDSPEKSGIVTEPANATNNPNIISPIPVNKTNPVMPDLLHLSTASVPKIYPNSVLGNDAF